VNGVAIESAKKESAFCERGLLGFAIDKEVFNDE
jgi:hypothetical protein